jgi:predicted Zn-dependent peptidase
MFEHMAFKGTPNIGTTDYAAEKKALEALEAAYQAYQTERTRLSSDPEKTEKLLAEFKERQEEAVSFVIKNEFGDIIDREGGTGLNAFTNSDSTGYFYSLPANKFELFAYLESERFYHPAFREFYKERDVVKEERRLRTESQPIGRLIEQFITTAYSAHPYKQPVVGYMSDLNSFTITDAEAFYRKHYVPANMVTALVGDLDAEKVIPVLEKYFGRIAKGPKPAPLRTVEPPQIAEKTVVLEDPSQPFYLEAYHKPSARHPDQEIYEAIDDILSRGRTSRLYRSLVRDKKIAVVVQSFSSFPGEKYPNLWAVFGIPARGIGNEEVQAAIRSEIERLKTEDVTDEELERYKTRAKGDLLRQLRDNQGMAFQFASEHQLSGDWREIFRQLEKVEKVTKEDIRRVANETFKDSNRTVAMIVTQRDESAAGQ